MNVAKNLSDFSNRVGLLSPLRYRSQSLTGFFTPFFFIFINSCTFHCMARCDINVAKNPLDFSNRVGLLSPLRYRGQSLTDFFTFFDILR